MSDRNEAEEGTDWGRFLFIFSLVLAGEAVFSLPFHVTRYFKPTLLEVFDFTNTELGTAQAAYGVVAMIAYFPGGPLADRFSPRKLLVISLVLTALGGIYMATIPGVLGMALLWGFWGVTSILLLWAALIRATRVWGGDDEQGTAFGILDGGRGLIAVFLGIAAAQGFQYFMPENPDLVSAAQRTEALQSVIYTYVLGTLGAAVLVWFGVPETAAPDFDRKRARLLDHIGTVLRRPAIWLQAAIVVAAYISYKATDNFGLFAHEAYGLDEVDSAWLSTVSSWVRPVAALFAGILADKLLSSKVISGMFVMLVAVFGYMAIVPTVHGIVTVLVIEVMTACVAIYGLRGVYFALFEEATIPRAVTGTAVGVVSVVGYTPDVFFGVFTGYLLDTYPGVEGHQYVFAFIALASAAGLAASVTFTWWAARVRARNQSAAAVDP